jgi:hypothetical protein
MPLIILPKPTTVTLQFTLVFTGETLTAALGVPFTQDISGQASLGVPPYTFSEIGSTGPDTIAVSSAGVISFTPSVTPPSFTLLTDYLGNDLLSASGAYLTE